MKLAFLDHLQPLGRALMLPIAVLPVAALFLRLGQPDLLAIPFVAAAGQAIFENLGLLFAAGVAVGLARENHGAAALAGIVCYLVATEGAKPLLPVPADVTGELAIAASRAKEIAKLSVPAGILSGMFAGALYNRFHAIALPAALGFFAGRRFVPIVSGLAGIGLAAVLGVGFPAIEAAIDGMSRWIVASGPIGLFLYGTINRLLLVTGLHHVLNNLAWFLVGDFNGTTGDLKRFFAGDPTAGGFMTGFFPVMMFGLPAACLAMYRAAAPERRKGVAGLYLSLALTSFLTGVTEPIEFTFLFVAPLLFAIHAVLTGMSMVLMDALGVKLGFGFSAGLFDYVLNYGLATRPLLLVPVGIAYFGVYYAVFAWSIRRFGAKVPGRDAEAAGVRPLDPPDQRAHGFVEALGGPANLLSVEACTTRLRLVLRSTDLIDRSRLSALGARGVLDLGGGGVQVVVGPEADRLASLIRPLAAGPDRQEGAAPPPGSADAGAGDADDAGLARWLGQLGVDRAIARGRRLIVDNSDRLDADAVIGVHGVVAMVRFDDATHLLFDRALSDRIFP